MATTSVPRDPPTEARTLRRFLLKKLISFPALLAALLVVALYVPFRDFKVDPDFWWHLKVGQSILATHHWPSSDTYSLTASGTPWIAYEWGGETLLAAVQRVWGLQGLVGLDLALAAAVLLSLYALAALRSRNSKAAFVSCALLLPLMVVSFSLRPQMLGYLFLILALIILERFRQGRSGTLWLLPLLFLVWVNTHGSFVIGIFAFGVYALSGLVKLRWGGLEAKGWTTTQRLQLGLVFLASLIALCATPYGVRLAAYPLDMAVSQPVNVASVQEWQPIPLNTSTGQLFLALVVGFLLAQVILRPTWQLAELTLFFAGVVAAFLHFRFVMLFVPFSAPLLGVIVSNWIPPYDPGKDKYLLNALLMAAAIAGVVRFFPSRARLEDQIVQRWPVKAVQYLRQHPIPRPMFNSYGYGGYLIYSLDDQDKVFIDGRGDIYERSGVFADYMSISRIERSALLLLRAYHVRSCFLERNEPLATLLAASADWQKVYADDLSVLFVRISGSDSESKAGDRGHYHEGSESAYIEGWGQSAGGPCS